MIVTDLETVNPQGRLDVIAYKGAKGLMGILEQQWGVSGLWDNLQPHIHKMVVDNVTGVEIPIEAKILLGILQANYKKSEVEG